MSVYEKRNVGLFVANEAENPRCPFPRINRRTRAAMQLLLPRFTGVHNPNCFVTRIFHIFFHDPQLRSFKKWSLIQLLKVEKVKPTTCLKSATTNYRVASRNPLVEKRWFRLSLGKSCKMII